MNCTRVNQGFVWVYKCAWSGDHAGTQLTLLPASRRADLDIYVVRRPRRNRMDDQETRLERGAWSEVLYGNGMGGSEKYIGVRRIPPIQRRDWQVGCLIHLISRRVGRGSGGGIFCEIVRGQLEKYKIIKKADITVSLNFAIKRLRNCGTI